MKYLLIKGFETLLNHFKDFFQVILMERSSSSTWLNSYLGMFDYFNQHNKSLFFWLLPWLSRTHDKLERLASQNMILSSASKSMYLNTSKVCRSLWEDQYNRHNAAVKALVPPDQLLVYRVGDGWDKICSFLGKKVPDTEFPYENKGGVAGNITDQYVNFDVYQRADNEAKTTVLKCFALSIAIVMGCWSVSTRKLTINIFN